MHKKVNCKFGKIRNRVFVEDLELDKNDIVIIEPFSNIFVATLQGTNGGGRQWHLHDIQEGEVFIEDEI
jgi:hypothetical protein